MKSPLPGTEFVRFQGSGSGGAAHTMYREFIVPSGTARLSIYFGHWAYGLTPVGTDTYVMQMRISGLRQGNEVLAMTTYTTDEGRFISYDGGVSPSPLFPPFRQSRVARSSGWAQISTPLPAAPGLVDNWHYDDGATPYIVFLEMQPLQLTADLDAIRFNGSAAMGNGIGDWFYGYTMGVISPT